MQKKCILIVLDGLADRSFTELGHMTPLQAARTPVLDGLARYGASGLYHASSVGLTVPAENSHFPLFGYNMNEFPGKSPLEALGAGIDLKPSDVAICAQLAGLREENGILFIETEKPAANEEELTAIFQSIRKFKDSGISIRLHRTSETNSILTLRGRVSPYITDSYPISKGSPLSDIVPLQKHKSKPEAQNSARILKQYCTQIYNQLTEDPVNRKREKEGMPLLNGLITRHPGQLKSPNPFLIRYGIKGLSIASGLVYQGISMYLGLDYIPVTGSSEAGADLSARLRIARQELTDYDFIHIRTSISEMSANVRKPDEKRKLIESLDTALGQELEPIIENRDTLVIVASENSIPGNGNIIRSGEPVPIIFCGEGVRRDTTVRYDEVSAAAGCLGLIRDKELFYLALNYIDRRQLAGITDSSNDQEFWPGNYPPFKL